MRRQTLGAGILVVIIIAVIARITIAQSVHAPISPKTSSPVQSASPAAIVSITVTGFNPATLSVARGTTVTWTNTDAAPHWVASDPYPADDALVALNSHKAFANGQSYSYTFTAAGTYTYHDETDPYHRQGSVMVHQ